MSGSRIGFVDWSIWRIIWHIIWTFSDMPKKSQESEGVPDKAKVRIFFAEVEGSNESVKEAVKAMVHAINRPASAAAAARLAGNGSAATLPAPSAEPAA